MGSVLRIANAGGFWGDRIDAAAELVRQQPELDFITIDYLAEVSMSILARLRERDPRAGYAADFVETVKQLAPIWLKRRGPQLRVIANAGGLNPRGCAEACRNALRDAGVTDLRIAIVTGDDVLDLIHQKRGRFIPGLPPGFFNNLETGESSDTVLSRLVTANAYLSDLPIAEALRNGADIVITGRVADPSLTVAACIAHFGWIADEDDELKQLVGQLSAPDDLASCLEEQKRLMAQEGKHISLFEAMGRHLGITPRLRDYDRLAAATIAGHLIECGTQVSGGISTEWMNVPGPARIGFPVIEMHENGDFVVTKPPGTGGRVDELTVKEQLLYEIGDPGRYLSPDATVSFLSLKVDSDGENRVRVTGAKGSPPPPTYKISATYRDGYRASGTLAIYGHDAYAKARRCAEVVSQRLKDQGSEPKHFLAEYLGAGSVVPLGEFSQEAREVSLRISVADERRAVVEQFSREIIPLVTAGPQGITGYFDGRPKVREVFGYWPCLIDRSAVTPRWEMITD